MTQALGALADRVAGPVIRPGDERYEEARRVYNGMIDARPAAIVRCATVDDVVAVVRLAADKGMELAVRGGGHSVPGFGTADGAVVADLSGLQSVEVDDGLRTAAAGGGTTWGRFNDVTAAHGLATTGGIIASTGIGGLTLGGGVGYLSRAHGLSCDNLLSARVVTADGEQLVASADDDADLFWALRGGGGNFGVVTEFTYRVHPIADVLVGLMFFELSDGAAVFRFFDDMLDEAPREYGGYPAMHLAPPLPFVPEARVGQPFAVVVSSWTGDLDEGQRFLDRFRQVAPPAAEMVAPMPYPALNALFDPLLPPGLQHYWKNAFVTELSGEAIAAHMEQGARMPAVTCAMHMYPMTGAVQDVPSDATAFGHRDARYVANIAGMWPEPADNERNIAWVRDYYAAIAPLSEAGGYTNFASADDEQKAPENYGSNYRRLTELKRRYDPGNLFHLNQNIRPVPVPEPRGSTA
ncbi:FAD-binding oxidoreductase [Blastococcus litoris]|uniref:FAD-binding oxidoreductase n=1 Tax=Blastococcus litoris TaxID=2171622 RepID=UPI000E30881A|nr:FAD-binding oxidoreductase [Blastococcus litoris]